MADIKRYFWLKFQEDFFTSRRIKKLRKLPNGDTCLVIYLKMQLKALKTDGILTFTDDESTFAEDIAIDIDEDEDLVKQTINFLIKYELLKTIDEVEYLLPYVVENTGSETASTQRSRECRQRQKVLQCNEEVLQCNKNATELQRDCNVEKEIEKEREKDKDNIYVGKKKRFTPPTLDQVKEYCWERNNKVDAERFIDYYESKGWVVGKSKMKDWKAAVRTWEGNDKREAAQRPKSAYERLMEVNVDD